MRNQGLMYGNFLFCITFKYKLAQRYHKLRKNTFYFLCNTVPYGIHTCVIYDIFTCDWLFRMNDLFVILEFMYYKQIVI